MKRVLVPVNVLRGETVSLGLMTLLNALEVTVVGYHSIPDQTESEQARSEYGDRATAALEDIKQEFEQVGVSVEHRLVFTKDRRTTIRRIAEETGAAAIAKTGPTGNVDRILVSLTGDVNVERILSFVEGLIGDRDIGVTLFIAGAESDETRQRLNEAVLQLESAGLDARSELSDGPPFRALLEAVPGHDAIVIGEKAPSFRALLFGDESERLASESIGPVIAVRPGA